MAFIAALEKMSFGSSKSLHSMDESEGRHFCYHCRKLIREGQWFILQGHPGFQKRGTDWSFRHADCEVTP
ncbi:hypothetical protein LCGC14_0741040 [marine sediment metagenome]|uniref:Uncharacterized protein n=1 Tax=marine sediment metagenome TaxID=412755 RepID=A0A0F9QAY7_9ZZZZ